jgi:hypothetical protein
MSHEKQKVIPVITAATDILKSLTKYPSNIPGKNDITELLKAVILGTVHLLQKVLM